MSQSTKKVLVLLAISTVVAIVAIGQTSYIHNSISHWLVTNDHEMPGFEIIKYSSLGLIILTAACFYWSVLLKTMLKMQTANAKRQLDIAPVIFIALNEKGNITRANKKACEILQYNEKELLGKNWFDTFLPEHYTARAKEVYSEIIKGTAEVYDCVEIPIISKDKERRIILWHNSAVRNNDGRTTGVICVGQDITERKQMELKLRDAQQKAVEASKAKSEFLANISHEIRTPMNAVIGFTELLSEQKLQAKEAEYVGIIKSSAESLLEIINDLLDFSKIESGKLNIDITECSLTDIIKDIRNIMQPAAQKKQLDFDAIAQSSLPKIIRTDAARIKQCLINLVGNAIKFTSEGFVYIKLATEDGGILKISVEDSGIGIAEDKQYMIFDAFAQAEASTTRKFGGTGLGLSITKQLVEMLGGKLNVKSEPNKGSRFTIKLKLEQLPNQQQSVLSRQEFESCVNLIAADSKKLHQEKTQFKAKILMAEDSKTNQKLFNLLLARYGLNADIANDGIEAIRKVKTQRYDLIFMDIQMPNCNGFDAMKQIRKIRKKTPIVALTANAGSRDKRKCLNTGFDDYLSKPINSNELSRVLEEYLEAKRTKQPQQNNPANVQYKDSVIDLQKALSVCGDEQTLKQISQFVLADSKGAMAVIDKAAETNDYVDMRLYAHKLKGCAVNIGAVALAKKAELLEQAAAENNNSVGRLIADIKDEYAKVDALLQNTDWVENFKVA